MQILLVNGYKSPYNEQYLSFKEIVLGDIHSIKKHDVTEPYIVVQSFV
jgi:hypothetical protein